MKVIGIYYYDFMKKLTEIKIQEILQGNAESLNTEFKATFDFNTNVWMREKLIRSIFAMSNTRDGGFIVIGIEEKTDKILNFTGIKDEHLLTFKGDDLKAKVESFSSSSVNYEMGVGSYKGDNYIVVSITEFPVSPIICRRNGEHKDKILEEGAMYVRTLKDKPSSVKLSNPVDVQDFIDRVADKQISNLHKRGWKHETENLVSKSDKSFFEKERKSF